MQTYKIILHIRTRRYNRVKMRGFTALAVFLGFGMVLIAVGQHVDSTCLDCIGKVCSLSAEVSVMLHSV